MDDLRTVNARLDPATFRRLALSARLNRRSLGMEVAAVVALALGSTAETEVDRTNGEIAVASFTRERRIKGSGF